MNNLGTLYELGQGVPRDLREAARLYRAASDQGYQISRANLGALYATGRGVQRDDREAVRLLQLAADDNEPNGLTTWARCTRRAAAAWHATWARPSGCGARPQNSAMPRPAATSAKPGAADHASKRPPTHTRRSLARRTV